MRSSTRPRERVTLARKPLVLPALLLAGIVAIGGAWLARRAGAPRIESKICSGCNLLLVTIDTLRSDRLHAFGGPEGLTPNLDRLADEGFRFTRTYASAPLTLPSHASILTATSPPVHGLRANGLFRLGPSIPTLATVLKDDGYRTGAFVGAFVLDARFGLDRGFDVYDDRYGERHADDPAEGAERRAEDVIKPALAWIHESTVAPDAPGARHAAPGSGSWFAWLHLYDPHEPYRAPEPYASRYAPYDAEVAYVDAQVGRLLADLRASGALERTLVAVAADHGESLGEHGERTHGVFVYDVTVRVPWIVWAGPRLRGASDAMARLIDVAPTLLDLLDVSPPNGFEGNSMVTRVRDGRESPPAYIEAMDANLTRNWAPLTAIVTGRAKLIDLPAAELYDLDADPKEMKNLYGSNPERARTLESLLRGTTAGFGGAPAEKVTLSAESRQRLQALGYVASSAGGGRRTYTAADDPKNLIGAAEDLNRALAAFRGGSADAAEEAVRAIVSKYPDFSTASGVLASMRHDRGDLAGAIATLETLARRGIADQSVLVVLAGYLQEAGRIAQSIELLEALVASHPDYAEAYNSLGVAYSRMGRHDRAKEAFQRVLALDPTSATAYENLGVDANASGDLAAAAAYLTRALELDSKLARAHNAMAAVLLRQGRRAEAIDQWRAALEIEPRLYDALYNLGTVLYAAGRRDEARPLLERFVAEAPQARYAADISRLRGMLR